MKFESKFGICEIVSYEPKERQDKGNSTSDSLLEVQGVYFGMSGKVDYVCRYPLTGVTTSFDECQLIGDPDFNQESGY